MNKLKDDINDIYHTWNGERFQFTLNKIAAISEGLIKIPDCYKKVADDPIEILTSASVRPEKCKGLTVFWIPIYNSQNVSKYSSYAEKGIVIISHVQLKDSLNRPYPMIKVKSKDDVRKAWELLGAYMKRVFDIPTISVTGSLGKTTTVLMMDSIFRQRHKVYNSGRKHNINVSELIVQKMLESYGPEYEYHIQEVGGGAPLVVERSASILDSDAFCIGNIMPHHLDRYKTIDGVLYDKISFDRVGSKNAFAVINIDDDILRNHTFKSRVVSCGIRHKEADYVAENIRQDSIWLKMDIVHNEERVSVSVNIPGIHNAYNVLLAYAMAKEWGLSNEEIQEGLLEYTSGPIRQNLREVAGRLMYIDCFNISADSIKSSLKCLDDLKPQNCGRRIAVIGGENALGDQAFSVNYATGQELGQYNADAFIFVGLPSNASEQELNYYGHGRAVYEGAIKVIHDRPVSFYDNFKDVADILANETKPGDIILFKGIFRLPFFSIIDRAFGTSITIYNSNFKGEICTEKGYSAVYYKEINGSNITKYSKRVKTLHIPETISGFPVFRIERKVFAAEKQLETIGFGSSIKCIGSQCFMGCTGLKSLFIPENVLYLEEGAFESCNNLEEVFLRGVQHIEKRAFANCTNLKIVCFTDSCQTIEADVFKGCSNVIIIAPVNSVAHDYAIKNQIGYQSSDENAHLKGTISKNSERTGFFGSLIRFFREK